MRRGGGLLLLSGSGIVVSSASRAAARLILILRHIPAERNKTSVILLRSDSAKENRPLTALPEPLRCPLGPGPLSRACAPVLSRNKINGFVSFGSLALLLSTQSYTIAAHLSSLAPPRTRAT